MPMGEKKPESEGINESLKSLGLTKYEALVYMALLQVEGATATEVHEISGVPRASVYSVIDKLIHKNIVNISNTTPKRFSAAPPGEAVGTLLGSIKKDADTALNSLNRLYEARPKRSDIKPECIWSISGQENIIFKLREAFSCAETEIIFISKWNFIRDSLMDILKGLNDNVRMEIITDVWEGEIPAAASVLIFEEYCGCDMMTDNRASGVYIIDQKKVILIMDSQSDDENPHALYSESYGFVHFFVTYWNFLSRHLKNSHGAEIRSSQ